MRKSLNFGKNHGQTFWENVYFLTLFKTLIFWSKSHFFSIQNIKKCFSLTWLPKKIPNEKSSISGQKPWTNPFRKMSFLTLFRTSICRSKNHSFLSKISKNDLYKLVFPKKSKWEKVWCLDKNRGLSPLENVDGLHFLTFYFFGLKIILFYPE